MEEKYDIHKAAGIIIRDKSVLVTRSAGKTVFVPPGGKIERNETPKQALIRELAEELKIKVDKNDLTDFATSFAKAAAEEDKRLRMDSFLVRQWEGVIKNNKEIAELRWIKTQNISRIKLGSIFRNEIIPELLRLNLIK